MSRATPKMIEYAQALILELGYDLDNYDFDLMDFEEVRELINDLKQERGY